MTDSAPFWNRRQLLSASGALGLGLGFGAAGGAATAERLETPATAQPDGLPPLTNRVADLEPPGPADFAARLDRARQALTARGLGALVVEATSSLGYFTGVEWGQSERVFAVVIPRRGDPVFVVPAFEAGRAGERIASGSEMRLWAENDSPYRRVAEVLAERGVASEPLAADPASRFFVVDGLRQALVGRPGGVVDGAAVIQACRGQKDAREIALMRRANAITEAAIARATASLREGMTEADVAAAVRAAHEAQGAPPGWALVLFGASAAYPHGTKAKATLRRGDLVLLDCGTEVHGYQSDISRTVACGPPSDRQRRIWELVRQAQLAAFTAARPGVACGAVDQAARQVIADGGFGPGFTYFTHRLGHGIGMDGHEWPYLVADSPVVLSPGMTTSNEPGIYLPGELGVRLEDIIHVTADGCEFLSQPMTELAVIDA
jgi:Xaa-Pro dipeptidase